MSDTATRVMQVRQLESSRGGNQGLSCEAVAPDNMNITLAILEGHPYRDQKEVWAHERTLLDADGAFQGVREARLRLTVWLCLCRISIECAGAS